MAIYVRGLKLGLDEPEELLVERAAARLRVPVGDIRTWAIVRRSLDARRHDQLHFIYNVELALFGSSKQEAKVVRQLRRADVTPLTPKAPIVIEPGREPMPDRPVVVGLGPAGMLAGFMLAKFGYRPLMIDRGVDVKRRHHDVLVDFYRRREFNPESNLLFGEGGAGTYSDGKLYTRVHDPRGQAVLEILYQHGADPRILIESRPHIGSDKLPGICRRLRLHIEAMGGEVRFGSRLDDVEVVDGVLSAMVVNGQRITCGPVILGVGHSARDTLRMLARWGIAFESKPFQLGVRIEHPQSMVDRWQYGPMCGHERLPPASYNLVAKNAAGDDGDVFSFCMCPGGQILPTNESAGQIVTNGASRSSHSGPFANAGLVVTLDPRKVCPGTKVNPLAAYDWLEEIERKAFAMTGESYRVPAQRASDFVEGRPSDGQLETSYPLGGQWSDICRILPRAIVEALRCGVAQLDQRRSGFGGPDAVIVAPETRASGPVRIVRDSKSRQSVSTSGLYPVGEGAGYAGGIVSAAIDGLKSAEAIISRYATPG